MMRFRSRPAPDSLPVGALLTALVALGQISTSIYAPSMPSLVQALATTPTRVALTFSLFLVGFAAGQLLFGPLSDRFGRRPVLMAGILLYIAASLACVLASSIETLIVGRFVQGVAASVGPVLGRAVVRDVYGPERSATAMAYIGTALAVSPAVAPVIGGYLQVWFGWRSAFVFLTVVGGFLLGATLRLLAETRPTNDDASPPVGVVRAWRMLAGDRRCCGYALSAAFVFAGLMAYTAGSPFVFIRLLGLSPERYGMLAVFIVAGFLAGTVTAGRLTQRIGISGMVLRGLVLCLFGGCLLLLTTTVLPLTITGIVLPMMIFGAGLGLSLAAAMAGAMAPFPQIAGAASALLGFVQMAVAAGASLAVGALGENTAVPMAATIATTAAVALALFTSLVRRESSAHG
jgi:DHA1 family bicyclomycin/chloramphenicol resistance-like MFS transporter